MKKTINPVWRKILGMLTFILAIVSIAFIGDSFSGGLLIVILFIIAVRLLTESKPKPQKKWPNS